MLLICKRAADGPGLKNICGLLPGVIERELLVNQIDILKVNDAGRHQLEHAVFVIVKSKNSQYLRTLAT